RLVLPVTPSRTLPITPSRTLPITPSPLAGEGWGGGCQRHGLAGCPPPPRPAPVEGAGEARAREPGAEKGTPASRYPSCTPHAPARLISKYSSARRARAAQGELPSSSR